MKSVILKFLIILSNIDWVTYKKSDRYLIIISNLQHLEVESFNKNLYPINRFIKNYFIIT